MQVQASDTTLEDKVGARFWNDEPTIGFYINSANRYILETVQSPKFGTTAGEWSMLDLLRGMHLGYDYINHIPSDYFDGYISRFEQTISEKLGKTQYIDRNKSTEYSRLMLTLSSLGYDVTAVGIEGKKYDFIEDLSESFTYAKKQGINGPIWEVIALNTGGYQLYDNERMQLPTNKEADINTIGKMIDFTLSKQTPDGGWDLSSKVADPDMTGMALQSLAPYYLSESRFNEAETSMTYEDFKVSVERGIKVLAEIQQDDAGYKSFGTPNSESIAQVIVALTTLNIDPLAPSITLPTINETVSFVKGDKNLLSAILEFYAPGTGSQPWIGGFKHVISGYDGGGGAGTTVNAMATDQATYALIAYERFKKGLNSLYDMSDMTAGQYKTLDASQYKAKFGEDIQQSSPYAVIEIPSAASTVGKTFTGWNTAQDGSGIAYAAGEKLIMPEHDIVLYPMYENNPVTAVEELIAALPSDIQFTEIHKLALDEARAAYANLSEEQQKLVTNYETLVEKENAYKAAEELANANVPLVSISLKDSVIELNKDETYQAEVIFNPVNTTDDQTITWTSSDESIATVDKNGKVTAINLGTATITAMVGQFTQTATVEVISDKPSTGVAGYVYVSFEDYAARVEGGEEFPEPLGVLIESTAVPYFEGDTIADVTVRLLDENGIEANYWGDTKSGFYLSSITNFTTPAGDYITGHNFGEFTAGQMSGWMISSNNWFINMGASEFLVEDGDIIRWQMTSQMGADIGNDWSNPSAEITGLNIDSKYGTLSPQFSEEEEYYTLTVPSDIDSIQVEALQANYWAQVTYIADGKQYKLLRDIPVQNGTQIEIYSAFAEYAGNPPSDEDWVYITIVKEEKTVIDEALQNVIDKITALPSLIAYEETHKLELDEVRTAYEALNETQKMLVANYQTLVEKENAYKALKEIEDAKVPLTAISVKEAAITLTVGDTHTAQVAFSPENTTDSKTLEYETSDASIVRVENGVLTAVAKGQATVTVQAANGLTATITVTVQAKLEAVVDRATKSVIDKIAALPSVITSDATHKVALTEVRVAYEKLTAAQKLLVTNYQTLVEKENAYQASLPEVLGEKPETTEEPGEKSETTEEPGKNPETSEVPSVNPGTPGASSVNPGTPSGSVPVSPSNSGQEEKPDVTKPAEMNKVDNKQQTTVNVTATPAAVVTVQSEEGIQITIPKAALQTETVDVVLQVAKQGLQISFASEGKDVSLKKYAEVAIPAEVLSPKEGAVLLRRLPDGSLVATPSTVEGNQFVLKTATSGEFVLSTENKTFKDIAKDGHKSYIEELAKRRIVNGKTEEIYDPTAGMTRGQFSAMLVRALDLHAEKEQQFQDAKTSAFAQELQALVEIGVLKGDGNQLKPGATVTRNQAALMIERLFTYLELDLPEVSGEELNFTDIEKIPESSKKSVALMQQLGIFTGKDDGRFDPNGKLTRSQMSKVIYKALTYAKMM